MTHDQDDLLYEPLSLPDALWRFAQWACVLLTVFALFAAICGNWGDLGDTLIAAIGGNT